MAVDIDGFAVLGAIARRPEVFAAARTDINKTARALVAKQLKDKGLVLDGFRAVATALGAEAFDLIADALSDAEVKALLAKVDKLNTEAKTMAPALQRKLLTDLAAGTAAPASKSVVAKPAKPVKPAKPPVERADNSKSMRAKRKV